MIWDTATGSMSIDILHALYTNAELSPTELVNAVLSRIHHNGDTAIWITKIEDHVLYKRAVELEGIRQRSSDLLREYPLFGVPFAVKDNIDVAGLQTTAAFPRKNTLASKSAEVVTRLEKAGAILFGKTNMDQFATGLVGTRSPYGIPRNPYNKDYIPGGSSSGSAVAVASNLVTFTLGTDTAGSGRVPAGMNELVGLKPTPGVFSTSGVFPACRSLDCVSVFARDPRDAATIANVLAGFDECDAFSNTEADDLVWQYRGATTFRFALPNIRTLEFFDDKECQQVFAKSIEILRNCGGIPVEIDFTPFLETARLLYDGPWIEERRIAFGEWIEQFPKDIDPQVYSAVAGSNRFSAMDLFVAQYSLHSKRQECIRILDSVDCLVVPTIGRPFTISEALDQKAMVNGKLGYYTNFVNLLNLCAVSVPSARLQNNVPYGVTFIGRPFHDNEILNISCKFMSANIKKDIRLKNIDSENSGDDTRIPLCVIGGHMSGLPLNHQLRECGASFIANVKTAPHYRIFHLNGFQPARPGMVHGDNGVTVEGELWGLTAQAFGVFVASIPAPLCIGSVILDDGRKVSGFLCEHYATSDARDISEYGGWRKYISSLAVS